MEHDMSFLIAFSAGILSFFSPCVLPLIPSYLTFLVGDYAKQQEVKNDYSIIPALLFIAGFTLVFTGLGISASLLGKVLIKNQNLLRKISGILIILLGLHLTGILKFKWLYREKSFEISKDLNKYVRSLILGIGLAFAWSPCIGPILSSILIYAGNSQNAATGALLLSFYSLGFAVPFFLVALSINWFLPRFKKLNPYLPLLNRITGILITILGILIYTDQLGILNL